MWTIFLINARNLKPCFSKFTAFCTFFKVTESILEHTATSVVITSYATVIVLLSLAITTVADHLVIDPGQVNSRHLGVTVGGAKKILTAALSVSSAPAHIGVTGRAD